MTGDSVVTDPKSKLNTDLPIMSSDTEQNSVSMLTTSWERTAFSNFSINGPLQFTNVLHMALYHADGNSSTAIRLLFHMPRSEQIDHAYKILPSHIQIDYTTHYCYWIRTWLSNIIIEQNIVMW